SPLKAMQTNKIIFTDMFERFYASDNQKFCAYCVKGTENSSLRLSYFTMFALTLLGDNSAIQ
ncbi:5834_t:CDS:1, partial [Funneliformis mosseae]